MLGRNLARGFQWIGDFKASSTWAREIRDVCNMKESRKGGNENSENFKKVCDWVDEQVESEGLLTFCKCRRQVISEA